MNKIIKEKKKFKEPKPEIRESLNTNKTTINKKNQPINDLEVEINKKNK